MTNPSHPKPWHRGSVFGPGTRHRLTVKERKRWRRQANTIRRTRRLPASVAVLIDVLLWFLGDSGQCDPSHATLAAQAGISESTVKRILDRLREYGLVLWENRLVRNGWRAEQTSNAYQLVLPNGAQPPVFPVTACDGQSDRQPKYNNDSILRSRSPRELSTAREDEAGRRSGRQQLLALGFACPW
jgi:hypothetical protein